MSRKEQAILKDSSVATGMVVFFLAIGLAVYGSWTIASWFADHWYTFVPLLFLFIIMAAVFELLLLGSLVDKRPIWAISLFIGLGIGIFSVGNTYFENRPYGFLTTWRAFNAFMNTRPKREVSLEERLRLLKETRSVQLRLSVSGNVPELMRINVQKDMVELCDAAELEKVSIEASVSGKALCAQYRSSGGSFYKCCSGAELTGYVAVRAAAGSEIIGQPISATRYPSETTKGCPGETGAPYDEVYDKTCLPQLVRAFTQVYGHKCLIGLLEGVHSRYGSSTALNEAAGSILIGIRDGGLFPEYIRLIKSDDLPAWKKNYVAKALGELGDKRAVESLLEAWKKQWSQEIAEALGRLGDVTVVDPLLESVRPTFSGLSWQVIGDALAELGKPAIPMLEKRRNDKDTDVRRACLRALERIQDKEPKK